MADGDITSEIISRIHSRRDDYDLDRIVIDRIGNRNYFNGMEIEDGYPDDPKAKLKLKSTLHNGSDINVVVKNGEPIIHFKDFPPSFCGDSKIAVCEGNSLL